MRAALGHDPCGESPAAGAAAAGMTEGERWARDEVQRLGRRRFGPAAIFAFLLASQRRSADVRRVRPTLARRARRWESGGLCRVELAGCRRRAAVPASARTRSCLVGGDQPDARVASRDGRVRGSVPRNLGVADALTLARAWLVPVIADNLSPSALAVAAVTHGLDGIAARATVPTRAGRDLEGLVDANVLTAAPLCAARERRLHPAWARSVRHPSGSGPIRASMPAERSMPTAVAGRRWRRASARSTAPVPIARSTRRSSGPGSASRQVAAIARASKRSWAAYRSACPSHVAAAFAASAVTQPRMLLSLGYRRTTRSLTRQRCTETERSA